MSLFRINLHETIFLLSDTLNLVSGSLIDHGKRVAFMAAECAKALGWENKDLDDLFLASLLHDCGVSKTAVYERMVHFEGKNAGDHCTRGAKLLQNSPPLSHLSDCVLHHHVDWSELQAIDLPDIVKMAANCINMVDQVDLLALDFLRDHNNILAGSEDIRKKISDKKDSWFHPQLVEVFLQVSNPEAFWLDLDKGHNEGYAKSWIAHDKVTEIKFSDLKSIALIYSRIVDEKSYYTHQHSEGVANLSRYLSERFDLPKHTCDKLEISGLLHDLGKLRVPDQILDKRTGLSEQEMLVIKRHSYDTYDILKDIQGFEDISLWASQHHERLDGSGYPYRLKGEGLGLESRIVAIADVFQSLLQDRPHRKKMSAEQALKALKQQGNEGHLDKEVIKVIDTHFEDCWKAASSLL